MKLDETGLEGLVSLTPRRLSDERGIFSETWNRATMERLGLALDFVQDNQSVNARAGTVRGLHYQAPPHAQAKLVRVVQGAILDVAVDMRVGSPGYGQWRAVELSAENGRQLLVPEGFLHGFVTRCDDTIVLYKTSAFYAPECDGAVQFADPALGIDWGIDPASAVVSDKDANAPLLADWTSPFRYAPPRDEGSRT